MPGWPGLAPPRRRSRPWATRSARATSWPDREFRWRRGPEAAHRRRAALAAASEVGWPVMVKASAGGGGIGMSVATDPDGLRAAFDTARTRAERFFGNPAILLERYVPGARHVEVQLLGLADGTVVALGERDCSVQRRHQKVAEETPSPAVSSLRATMLAAAIRAGETVGYRGRHGRVPARSGARRLLLPRNEHPAAGRAPRDRARHRDRPRRAAAAHCRRRERRSTRRR